MAFASAIQTLTVPEMPFQAPIVSAVGWWENKTLLCVYFLCSYMYRVGETVRAPTIGHSTFSF